MNQIVLVSSAQPSANPRLVKEAKALSEDGYKVSVLYCPLSPWVDDFDKILFSETPQIKWISVGYHPHRQFIAFKLIRLRKKWNEFLWKIFKRNSSIAIKSIALYSQELKNEVLRHKADLYIGHNIGALQAVVCAAKKYNKKAAFDFEDFHRGECEAGTENWEKISLIEKKFVPLLSYATAASPLIKLNYQELFPKISFLVVNNCFPVKYAADFVVHNGVPLRLFWFSQFIGKERGIETVIQAMGKTGSKDVRLTLMGNCTEKSMTYFREIANEFNLTKEQLEFLPPVIETEIFHLCSLYDIGLACEPARDKNNDIALSNKLFTYLICANAIIYSDTSANRQFFNEHSETGTIYKIGDYPSLAVILNNYIANPDLLNKQRLSALKLAKEKMNWEREKTFVLRQVKNVLNY